MRVAHVIYSVNSFEFKELIGAFIYQQQESGTEAEVIHIIKDDEASRVLKIRHINVHTYTKSPGADLGLSVKLSRLFREKKYNVIHVHNLEAAAVAGLGARLARIPAVLTLHCVPGRKISGVVKWLYRHVVCASQYIQQKFDPEKPVSQVIYDGIDVAHYARTFEAGVLSDIRKKFKISDESFVIGNVGPLIKSEDQLTLLKCFRKLQAKGLKSDLILTGDGPLKEHLESFVRKYNLTERVHFAHEQIDRVEALQLLDVLVLTANVPRYPFVLLEAMSAGTAVITTKIGSNPEVIVERKTGALVPCGFPERIDSAIMRMNAIKTLPAEMGANARAHMQEHFTIAKMVQNYQSLYSS